MRWTLKALAFFVALSEVAQAEREPDEPDTPTEPADLRQHLTDSQRDWWEGWYDDDGQLQWDIRYLRCGRRWGKSTVACYWLVDGAIGAPRGSYCVYVSLTKTHAEEAMWSQIKDAAIQSGVPHKVWESKLTIRFAGGGSVLLAGCDTKREIDKFRSKKIVRAVVDECGSIKPSLLKYLDESVLEPACMDYGGLRVYSGTPPEVPVGWWYEQTHLGSSEDVLRETAADNPHIVGGAEAYWDRICARRGWTRAHPTFRREYKGEDVIDVGELVFPLDALLDGTPAPGRNTVRELPTHNEHGALLDPSRWRYAIGIDLGYVHASAFVVMAAHPGLAAHVYAQSVEKHVGWLTPQIRDRLRELKAEYPTAAVVADTGGYGKPIVEELRRLWGTWVEAAEKSHKSGQVRLVRDEVIAGTFHLLDGSCDPLREEWFAMGWGDESRNEDPNEPSPRAEDHASDATLYARRRLRHYVQVSEDPPPSPQELAAKARREKFARLDAMNRRRRQRGQRGSLR